MARTTWPLLLDRPRIRLALVVTGTGVRLERELLADTGAGSSGSFELVLEEPDCLLCGAVFLNDVSLGGAYAGTFPMYLIQVQVPGLLFDQKVRAIGVTAPPHGFQGIACFSFLNRFAYGNFGNPNEFGLEI
jgi:hypothetical protein